MLRLLKLVRQEDIHLMRKYLGIRLAFAADLLDWMLTKGSAHYSKAS